MTTTTRLPPPPADGKGRTSGLLLLRKTQMTVGAAACGLLTPSALSFAPRRRAGDFLTGWAVALCGCKSQIHKTP